MVVGAYNYTSDRSKKIDTGLDVLVAPVVFNVRQYAVEQGEY